LWAAILFVPALLGVYAFVREGWVHDRQMYLVSVPVCMIAAAFLTDPAWPRRASVSASFAVVVFLLIDLAVQVPRFADNASIYASALKVAPRSLYLHAYYAAALAGYGRTEEALREYKITAELEPQSPAAHEWYAGTLAELGRDEDAMAEYEKALGLSGPTSTFRSYILSRMADLEIKHSDFPKAVLHLREAVQLSPESPDYHTSLARALGHEGQTQEADEQIRLEAALRQRAAQQRRASGN
jgi:tetratricopeptide (TPR) repeat protein